MPFSSPAPLAAGHDPQGFSCGQPALDHWLIHHAAQSHAAGSARVFATVDSVSGVVAGFYALAAGQVDPEAATARLAKGQPRSRAIPVVILARLAVDHRYQRQGLGASLLRDALLRVLAAGDSIGIRAVLVHAKDDEARQWYEQYGFECSPTDPLHLVLLMKDLKRFVSRQL